MKICTGHYGHNPQSSHLTKSSCKDEGEARKGGRLERRTERSSWKRNSTVAIGSEEDVFWSALSKPLYNMTVFKT